MWNKLGCPFVFFSEFAKCVGFVDELCTVLLIFGVVMCCLSLMCLEAVSDHGQLLKAGLMQAKPSFQFFIGW
jgi:hypothetical protein